MLSNMLMCHCIHYLRNFCSGQMPIFVIQGIKTFNEKAAIYQYGDFDRR